MAIIREILRTKSGGGEEVGGSQPPSSQRPVQIWSFSLSSSLTPSPVVTEPPSDIFIAATYHDIVLTSRRSQTLTSDEGEAIRTKRGTFSLQHTDRLKIKHTFHTRSHSFVTREPYIRHALPSGSATIAATYHRYPPHSATDICETTSASCSQSRALFQRAICKMVLRR